jgi:hypothetical protein
MKRKSGLHKKVSSIFGDIPLPANPKPPVAGEQGAGSGLGGLDKPLRQYQQPAEEPAVRVQKKSSAPLTEEQEYAAEQRKKLFMVIGLAIVLGVVLFVQFYKPNKTAKPDKSVVAGETSLEVAAGFNISKIDWVSPDPWVDNVRDPMVFKENKARLFEVESKVKGPLSLRGIVHKTDGKSMALIGIDILYIGEEIDGWTLKEVQHESVKLENAEGEKLELKMKDR